MPPIGWRWLGFVFRQRSTGWVAWLAAGTATGVCFALADCGVRFATVGASPGGWAWRTHAVGTFSLYAALGLVLGFGAWLLGRLEPLARMVGFGLGLVGLPGGLRGVLAPGMVGAAVAFWVWTASFAPPTDLVDWFALAAAVTGSVALVAIGPAYWGSLARGRRRWLVAGGAGLLGCVSAWLDMTVLVSLYPFLHAVAEVCTAVFWLLSFRVLAGDLIERSARRRLVVSLASVAAVLALAFLVLGGPSWAAGRLRHTAMHHVYAGRILARSHQLPTLSVETVRRQPEAEASQRTMIRHDARPVDACPAAWWPADAPAAPASLRAEIPEQPNIVVFFVDTLRADVANDPRIMPNLARFARASQQFTRTYSTGSDTRSCLPAMMRGSYDLQRKDEYDVLHVARAHGMPMALAIGSSPRDFLSKHVPQFRFDEVLEVPDSDVDKKVWGYGAHLFTSDRLVDESLAWLAAQHRKRFLLWQFHYDLHGWRELDQKELWRKARALGVPRLRGEWGRYSAVAGVIDAEFGRFLRELERMDLRKDTVIVFLADHGEGMGRQGFWLHSVFLWESLVRVPLVVHLPGLDGQKIDTHVSTIDLGPTLVRLIDPNASLLPYHGEDLLTQLGPDRPPRRFPMLMRSVLKEQVARLGVIDPESGRKLVLPVETGQPEVHDLSASEPDDVDIALSEPATAERLLPVVSDGPMNPRARRKHERCWRTLSDPDPEADSLATEGRQMKRAKTGGPT